MVGRFGWIDSGGAYNVERDERLFGELVPQLQWEVDVGRAEAAYHVIFVCLNCPFRRIYAMVCRLNELPCAVLFL